MKHKAQEKQSALFKLPDIDEKRKQKEKRAKIQRCHSCERRFDDCKEVRYHYGTNAFGGPGVYCSDCIEGVRAALLKSKVPYYVDFIEADYREY